MHTQCKDLRISCSAVCLSASNFINSSSSVLNKYFNFLKLLCRVRWGKKRGCVLTFKHNMNLKLIPQLFPHKRIDETSIKILWMVNILKTTNRCNGELRLLRFKIPPVLIQRWIRTPPVLILRWNKNLSVI